MRENFLVDDEFSVVLEQTDFGYVSGEIALLTGDGEFTQKQERIDAFLEKYAWLCAGTGDSVLAAYRKNFGVGERIQN